MLVGNIFNSLLNVRLVSYANLNGIQAKAVEHPRVRKRKPQSTSNKRPTANYNLGYFLLLWNRMEREGDKEASARLILLEDDASSSTRLRVLLGCGKPTADSLEIKCKKSGIVINGRTSTFNSTPEVRSLVFSVEGERGEETYVWGK